MNERENLQIPAVVSKILAETIAVEFQMASEPLTGSLLKTLAASKRSGKFLELGTGTGIGTAWILEGMDDRSSLITVDNNIQVARIAKQHLKEDLRVTFKIEDAAICLEHLLDRKERFDFIFADTWIGKYSHLDAALSLLELGGFYIIDDMLPQPNWIEGHELKVKELIKKLKHRRDLTLSELNWASGIIIATKITTPTERQHFR